MTSQEGVGPSGSAPQPRYDKKWSELSDEEREEILAFERLHHWDELHPMESLALWESERIRMDADGKLPDDWSQ